MIEVFKAEADDAIEIAPMLREADKLEIHAASGKLPEERLLKSVDLSTHCFKALFDGELLSLFGVGPISLLSGVGVPWLVATDAVMKARWEFLAHCPKYMGIFCENYDVLINYVDKRNIVSIRWLKWLGFTIEEPQPYGPYGLPFHRFTMERS